MLIVATALGVATGLVPLALGGATAAGLGQFCGGILGIQCDQGLFCEFGSGTCGRFDQGGTCARVPRFCPLIYRPVCGCNGKTFVNNCTRQVARVSLKHNGRC
jgi:Kazal-type serine protease inhibitor domain